MTRRGLISTLLGAATLDPERLLWVPGAKVISIPKRMPLTFPSCEVWQAYHYEDHVFYVRIDAGAVTMEYRPKSKITAGPWKVIDA